MEKAVPLLRRPMVLALVSGARTTNMAALALTLSPLSAACVALSLRKQPVFAMKSNQNITEKSKENQWKEISRELNCTLHKHP
jgi:hypothetical protein